MACAIPALNVIKRIEVRPIVMQGVYASKNPRTSSSYFEELLVLRKRS